MKPSWNGYETWKKEYGALTVGKQTVGKQTFAEGFLLVSENTEEDEEDAPSPLFLL